MTSVVVLTQNWIYWGKRSLKDAIRLYIRGKVEIVKANESRYIYMLGSLGTASSLNSLRLW